MPRATTTERSRPMKRTRNGILIPDVPIMAGGNLPNAVKGVSAGKSNPLINYLVDLGLPSGTKWAMSNIDETAPLKLSTNPFSYQSTFYSSGNVIGQNPVDGNFENAWTQQNYDSTTGSTLSQSIPVNPQFDAARLLLGEGFSIPTGDQIRELDSNCDFIDAEGNILERATKVTVNGCVGMYRQSKINGKKIFFPAAGYGENNSLQFKGLYILVPTSTLQSNTLTSIQFNFYNNYLINNNSLRYYGMAIRPVYND